MTPRFFPRLAAFIMLVAPLAALGAPDSIETGKAQSRHLIARKVFNYQTPILFQDDFRSGVLDRWNLSENDQYELFHATPERIQIVDAPGSSDGRKAVRLVVERAPNSFRSEISLPSETGFQERWYAEQIFIPQEWVFDPVPGNDIVMQWHAIPGNWRPTFPNLEISLGNRNWFIKQSFGSPQTQPTRTAKKLDDPVQPGAWVSWIIHAKWSPGDDGLLQIWKDGKLVLERKGTNVYATIGAEYTPYLKTGIYHPEWHLDKDGKREAFEKATPVATRKIIFVTGIRVGDERAQLDDFLSQPHP